MEVRLIAVGDILTHLEIVKASEEKGFDMLFENMMPYFANADILLGNQETTLTDRVKPSGFPVFATPTGVGIAEENAGFSLLTLATNHTLDLGRKGMEDAVTFWSSRAASSAIGIRKKSDGNEFSNDEPFRVIEKNGIRIAFLNYTDPTNLHHNPIFGNYSVPLLRPWRKSIIKNEIRVAKEQADFTVVCAHWGIEYLYEPVKSQKKWAAFFADAGADVIIGTHPHVVEPLETVINKDQKQIPVYYSLGNFISCQCFPGTMLGGLADIIFKKENGECSVSCSLEPLVAHAAPDLSVFSVYPLKEYDKASSNRIISNVEAEFDGSITEQSLMDLFTSIQNGTASQTARFKKPSDVRLYNAGRILKLLKKHAPH